MLLFMSVQWGKWTRNWSGLDMRVECVLIRSCSRFSVAVFAIACNIINLQDISN